MVDPAYITIPREAAFEVAAFLEAVADELAALGADINEVHHLQDSAYNPIAVAVEAVSTLEEEDNWQVRRREFAGKLATLVDLNLARRVTALEEKQHMVDLRLDVLEKGRHAS